MTTKKTNNKTDKKTNTKENKDMEATKLAAVTEVSMDDLLANLAEKTAKAKPGGKSAPEYSEAEVAVLRGLAERAVSGEFSQRNLVLTHKELHKQRQSFPGIDIKHTPNSFEKKFVEIYKQVKAEQS